MTIALRIDPNLVNAKNNLEQSKKENKEAVRVASRSTTRLRLDHKAARINVSAR